MSCSRIVPADAPRRGRSDCFATIDTKKTHAIKLVVACIVPLFFVYAVAIPSAAKAAIVTSSEITAQLSASAWPASGVADNPYSPVFREFSASRPKVILGDAAAAVSGTLTPIASEPFDFSSEAYVSVAAVVYADFTGGFIWTRLVLAGDVSQYSGAWGLGRLANLPRVTYDVQMDLLGDGLHLEDISIVGGHVSAEDFGAGGRVRLLHRFSSALQGQLLDERSLSDRYVMSSSIHWTSARNADGTPLYPGADKERPLPGFDSLSDSEKVHILQDLESELEPIIIPSEVTGSFLTNPTLFQSPVVGDYGTSDSLYFGGDPVAMTPDAEVGLLRTASQPLITTDPADEIYFFLVMDDSPLFASFAIADLDPTASYTVYFANQVVTVNGGDTLDFLATRPEGVEKFFVTGLNLPVDPDAAFPAVFAASFAAEGTAAFSVGRIVPETAMVPEPTSLCLVALVAAAVCTRWRR